MRSGPEATVENDYAKFAGALEDGYVDITRQRVAIWKKIGLLEVVDKLIGLRDGESHVDVGSRLGHVLASQRNGRPNARLMGVESSQKMISAAVAELGRLNIEALAHTLSTVRLKTGQRGEEAIRKFRVDDEYIASHDPFATGSPILLLGDDMRDGEVTRRVIGGRRIDSASCINLSASAHHALEYPFVFSQADASDLIDNQMQVQAGMREGTYDCMSEIVRPGGRMVIADEVALPTGPISTDLTDELIDGRLDRYGRYWDVGEVLLLDRDIRSAARDRSIAWVPPVSDGNGMEALSRGMSIRVLVARLLRNNTVLPESGLVTK